jgi:hypothetical protein
VARRHRGERHDHHPKWQHEHGQQRQPDAEDEVRLVMDGQRDA